MAKRREYNDFDDTIGKPHRIFCPNCQQWLPAGNTIHTCYDYHAMQINEDRRPLSEKPMTKGQFCQDLEIWARSYLNDMDASIKRNKHMFSFRGKVNKKMAIAILVDYINHIAAELCGDLGLMERHLTGKNK